MRDFLDTKFNPEAAARQLLEFAALLSSKAEIEERVDVLVNRERWKDLFFLFSALHGFLGSGDKVAWELEIAHRFRCDFAVGSSNTGQVVFVEFENGKRGSLFDAREYWGRDVERGVSLTVDWMWALSVDRYHPGVRDVFGRRHFKAYCVVVCGRDRWLDETSRDRLEWREANMTLRPAPLSIITYDEFFRFSDGVLAGGIW